MPKRQAKKSWFDINAGLGEQKWGKKYRGCFCQKEEKTSCDRSAPIEFNIDSAHRQSMTALKAMPTPLKSPNEFTLLVRLLTQFASIVHSRYCGWIIGDTVGLSTKSTMCFSSKTTTFLKKAPLEKISLEGMGWKLFGFSPFNEDLTKMKFWADDRKLWK